MKIVEMRVTPVAIADPPLFSSFGLHAPYALRTIVELIGEDGLSGAGETYGGEAPVAQLERARPAVIGRDVFDLNQLWHDVAATQETPEAAIRTFSALEVAALDLAGKAVGRPVCDLLGGKVRDEVPFSAYLFYKRAGGGGEGEDARPDEWGEALTPEGIVAQAKLMRERYGFGSIKLKGGVFPPDEEIAAILAMYEALGPDVPLRIDPNDVWTVETSVRVGVELGEALEYLEDPTHGLEQMAAVREGLDQAGIDTPLASNMAVSGFDTLPETVRSRACQVVLCDHHYWGGLRATTQLGRLCETFGLGMSMHSNSHLGVSLLAMVHVAAATPHLSYACDTHYPWQGPADEVLAGGRIQFVDGSVPVPTAPGLGAELDQDALARGRERYERCDYRVRDDIAEMRKYVDPNWTRVMPRW